LCRTLQTAEPLAERLGLTPFVEPDLREVFLGDWEGGEFRIRAAAGDPLFARLHQEERWDVIPGAEALERFDARCARGLARIVEKHPDQRVMVVAHGGVIGQLLHQITGARRFAFTPDNASISEVVVHPTRTVLRRFNDVAHLQG
jgi:probable phosphoglycerate mutase